MTTPQTVGNPFALMMDPEAVFAALARSDRLGRLKSRVCRPVDKPRPGPGEGGDADTTESSGDDPNGTVAAGQ